MQSKKSCVASLGFLSAYALAQPALAQPVPAVPSAPDVSPPPAQDVGSSPPPTPPPADAAPAVTHAQRAWAQRYGVARSRLFEGQFKQCTEMFQELDSSATDQVQRLLALEQGSLCRAWADRDLVLVPRSSYEDTALAAKAHDRRTTDEISILYLNSVVYGLGTGLWVDVLAEPESPAGAVLPPLALAGGSAGVVALIDSGRGLGYGVPQTIVTGMYIGFQEGLFWTLWNQARVTHADEWEASTAATVIWGASTAGAITGGIVGSTYGTTPGRASFVGSASLWTGAVAGLLTASVASEDDYQDDYALLAVAMGINAGAVAGALAAGPVSPSIARVRYLDLGGISGGLLFGGLAVAAEADGRPTAGLTALGIATGLGIAWSATSSMPEDRLDRTEATQSALADIHVAVQPMQGGGGLALFGSL